MSLSFEESLKKNLENNVATNDDMVATMNIDDASSVMTLDETPMVVAYSGSDGSWRQHSDYVTYSTFYDE